MNVWVIYCIIWQSILRNISRLWIDSHKCSLSMRISKHWLSSHSNCRKVNSSSELKYCDSFFSVVRQEVAKVSFLTVSSVADPIVVWEHQNVWSHRSLAAFFSEEFQVTRSYQCRDQTLFLRGLDRLSGRSLTGNGWCFRGLR